MELIGGIFLLILLIQFLLIVAFRQPKKLFATKIISKSNLYPVKVTLFVVMGILYLFLFIELGKYHKPQPLMNKPYSAAIAYPTVSPGTVVALGARKTSSIVNLYYLYMGPDKSEKAVGETAMQLRHQYCVSLCMINIYDDKKAFDLDMQRVQITSAAQIKAWNVANYVYVGDHYLGYLDAVENAQFAYYPLHDGYYKHAKEGTLSNY